MIFRQVPCRLRQQQACGALQCSDAWSRAFLLEGVAKCGIYRHSRLPAKCVAVLQEVRDERWRRALPGKGDLPCLAATAGNLPVKNGWDHTYHNAEGRSCWQAFWDDLGSVAGACARRPAFKVDSSVAGRTKVRCATLPCVTESPAPLVAAVSRGRLPGANGDERRSRGL